METHKGFWPTTMSANSILEFEKRVNRATRTSNNIRELGAGGVEMEDQAILEVRNLSISFGGIQAVTDISLDVGESEILGLIGPNGAGKTVLLNCINGLYTPNKGIILFQGTKINGLPRHKVAPLGIARTFQQIELFKQMNVIENTLVGGHFRAKSNICTVHRVVSNCGCQACAG